MNTLKELIKEQEELLNSIPTSFNQEWVDKAEKCIEKFYGKTDGFTSGLEILKAGENNDRLQDEWEKI